MHMCAFILPPISFFVNALSYFLKKFAVCIWKLTTPIFTGNVALTYISSSTCKGTFYNCSFERGVPNSSYDCTFDNSEKTSLNYTNLYLYDCTLGGATFLSRRNVEVKNLKTGSIFGEGSLTMVVAILALVASAASIGVTMSLKKRLELANVAPAKAEDDE